MKALKWVNAGAFTAMVSVNALANLLPIAGKTTGQISQAYPSLFTPAPITFSVWGVIYLLMLFFTVYQLGLLDHGKHSIQTRERVGIWFAVSCVLNILWLFLWHFQRIGLSALCIALLLIVLNGIVKRLNSENSGSLPDSIVQVGFSLYYGWIIAATLANVSVYLIRTEWGLSADLQTITLLVIGALISVAVTRIGKNRVASAAVLWAYIGILVRHISPAYYGGTHPYIISTAVVSAMLILAAIVLPGSGKTSRTCCSTCNSIEE